jgi:hypothetical protein
MTHVDGSSSTSSVLHLRGGGAPVMMGSILVFIALLFSYSVSIIFRIFLNAIPGVILFFVGSEVAIVVKEIGDKKNDFYVMLLSLF